MVAEVAVVAVMAMVAIVAEVAIVPEVSEVPEVAIVGRWFPLATTTKKDVDSLGHLT